MRIESDLTFDNWTKPGWEVFEFWISFFPTAPLFGVDWRFGSLPEAAVAPKAAKPPALRVVKPAPAAPKAKSVKEKTKPVHRVSPEASVKLAAVEPESTPKKPAGLLKKMPADADDLKQIKGIGPGLEKQLNTLGVYRFKQLAKFKEKDLSWIDENLTAFKGRCYRDDWVGQAKALLG